MRHSDPFPGISMVLDLEQAFSDIESNGVNTDKFDSRHKDQPHTCCKVFMTAKL